ncbi:uncharacterized protein A4U43_C10F17220 [Asparagus officinalis]|uniref:Histidine-containing phosphotransfer protein n=1 Tax=Asparagus officinalis TaxID=4686 RepID=A0A5P1E3N4_ASPOF|nr:uncharacterized protein A4U43_C10F17220 [Asparagus officinalis]
MGGDEPEEEAADAFGELDDRGGLLDQQFNQLLMLEEDGSGFLAEVIKLFCDDSERMMSELSNLLDQDVVDYQKVDSFVHQLKGSSSSDEKGDHYDKLK